jgi:uncharacterized OsmC-like protein
MYSLQLTGGEQIALNHRRHVTTFAMDGSLPNPLEVFYAALAACAGVYAHKACKKLGLDSEGIAISCQPFTPAGHPLALKKFKTTVSFPERFRDDQRAEILQSISHCAVKEIVREGASIEFEVLAMP